MLGFKVNVNAAPMLPADLHVLIMSLCCCALRRLLAFHLYEGFTRRMTLQIKVLKKRKHVVDYLRIVDHVHALKDNEFGEFAEKVKHVMYLRFEWQAAQSYAVFSVI